MSRRLLVVAALLVLPTVVSAQRGRGFGRDEGAQYSGVGSAGGLQLSNGDVEDMSPIKLLIDKRKDLKLADDKVKQLKDIEGKMKEKLEPSLKTLDTLRRDMRPPAGGGRSTDQDRSRSMMARGRVSTVVLEIRTIYDAAYQEALPLFDETQQKAANELVEKQKAETEEKLREKIGGRGNRGG